MKTHDFCLMKFYQLKKLIEMNDKKLHILEFTAGEVSNFMMIMCSDI